MSHVVVTKDNFEDEVLNSDIPVLVDFWAEWCGPCQMLGPVLEEISEEYNGRIKICKVNVDDEMELAVKYKIESIPMMYFFKNGEQVDGIMGFNPKPKLVAKIEANI